MWLECQKMFRSSGCNHKGGKNMKIQNDFIYLENLEHSTSAENLVYCNEQ